MYFITAARDIFQIRPILKPLIFLELSNEYAVFLPIASHSMMRNRDLRSSITEDRRERIVLETNL